MGENVLWTGGRQWTNPFRRPDGVHAPLLSRPGLVEAGVTLAVLGVLCLAVVLLELRGILVGLGIVLAGSVIIRAIVVRLARAHSRRPVRYRLTFERLTESRTDWRGRTVERSEPLGRLVPELREGSADGLGTITFAGTDLAIRDIADAAEVYELIVRTRT